MVGRRAFRKGRRPRLPTLTSTTSAARCSRRGSCAFAKRPRSPVCASSRDCVHLTAQHIADTSKILASTSALPPDLRQKGKEIVNGCTCESPTMHLRKCKVQLTYVAWLHSPKCMVALAQAHGSAFASQTMDSKDLFWNPKITTTRKRQDLNRTSTPP